MRPLDPRLMRYARSARRHIAIISGLGLLTAALVIAQTLLISGALSPVVAEGAHLKDVLPTIGILCLVIAARAATTALRDAMGHRAAEQAIRELRGAVITRIEDLGPRWRSQHGSDASTLLTRGLSDLAPYFVDFLPQLILVSTVTPLALATILLLDFWSALIAALVIPLIPLFMILVGRFTQDASQAKLASMERLGSQMLDLLVGLPTLRGLGREKGPREHMRRLGADNTRATMATLRVAFLSGGVLEFLATLSVALVAVEIGMRLVTGNVSLFTGLAVIMLAPEVFDPLRQVGAQFHASANGVAAAQAAFEILETPISPADARPASRGPFARGRRTTVQLSPATPAPAQPSPDLSTTLIRCSDLSCTARGTWAPDTLSFDITPGTITALVGHSGAGKTTTVQTLLGLHTPTRGEIALFPHYSPSASSTPGTHAPEGGLSKDAPTSPAGIPISSIERDSYWRNIAWVPQSPTLLPGTLRDNLPQIDDENALREAAEATGFDLVLDTLPLGWETEIGQGGLGLSVGQRQRFALTRTLLDTAPLVILDEPTAHLDAVSEEIVVRALTTLRSRGQTVIVIAHRSAVVEAADQVVTVESRRATPDECGRWPELARIDDMSLPEVTLPGFLDERLLSERTLGAHAQTEDNR